MTQNEFARQQQAAVERMREMNARAQINRDTSHKMPPVPSFVRLGETSQYQNPYNQKTNTPSAKEQTKNPTPKHTAKVNIITKNVIFPTDMIVFTDNDAPKSTIAAFSIFLDVNFSAGCIHLG